MACGSKEFQPPFPFPQRGKPGRGRFPPRRKHAARQQKTLSRIDAAGSPHKRAAAPLCIPCEHRFCIPNQCGKENIREMKNKDGRHVVLDFYDLLIEPIMKSILSGVLACENLSVREISRREHLR
jgi:hypothetical protein